MDDMAQNAARGWDCDSEELERLLTIPAADNPAYDQQAVLLPGERDRLEDIPGLSPHPGEWLDNPAGVPPTFVPRFEDVLNRGSPPPGTWIYMTEARMTCGACLPVLRMVYWDQESDTWRRFMATPDCFAPVTVPQPWTGSGPQQGQPPLGTAGRGPRPAGGAARLARGLEYVRTERRTLPPNEARIMGISVRAINIALGLLENNAGGHPSAPTPEEVAFAAASAVNAGIIELSDSSSSDEHVEEHIANNRRTGGGTGYRPVRSTPSSATRGSVAYPDAPARRRPRG